MKVEWGVPRQLEDYGVLICLFAFHVAFGVLSVAVRIPVYNFDANVFLSAAVMVLVFFELTKGARRLQRWLFMCDRYPLSTFEASVGMCNDTISVVEWLVILLGQYSGVGLCWERWLLYSLDPYDRRAALLEFAKPLSPVVVYTLIMSVALFNYKTSKFAAATSHGDDESILFVSLLAGMVASINTHLAEGTPHRVLFLGLSGIYRVSHHGAITLALSTMLHATIHVFYQLLAKKTDK